MWSSTLKATVRSFALRADYMLYKHADYLKPRQYHYLVRRFTGSGLPVNIRPLASLSNSCRTTGLTFCQRRNFVPSGHHSVTGFHENISALQAKKRVIRRRGTAGTEGLKLVVGYTTAEEYDLEGLLIGLRKQDLYIVKNLTSSSPNEEEDEDLFKRSSHSHPDVLHAVAKYVVEEEPREIFFFREGSIVLWNVREEESANIIAFLKPYEVNPYDERLVMAEREFMPYKYLESNRTKILHGCIILPSGSNLTLEKYAVSNALSSSVKLGVWEASLEGYIASIEFVTDDLKMGRKIRMSREEVLRKHGELFALRHLINLSSDLLDTPDFYWEHDDLETVYQEGVSYFSIGRRTRVMNEKLNHCVEVVELISSHLNDKHHVRLEWMIIILIMVEVVFEVLHFAERLLHGDAEEIVSSEPVQQV